MTVLLFILLVIAIGVAAWLVRGLPWRLSVPLALGVIILSAAIYGWLGALRLMAPLAEYQHARVEAVAAIDAAKAQVQAAPQNPGAWAKLGQVALMAGDLATAQAAYTQAVIHSGGEPMLILQLVKAQIFASDGRVNDKAAEGLALVRAALPENAEAQYFEALLWLQEGRLPEAMTQMKALYAELPDDSPLKTLIDRQIGRE